MQRALVILAVFVLVAAALAVGALASHWPFWNRAWQWQFAANGWPESLPGPTYLLRGGDVALPLHLQPDSGLQQQSGTSTSMLLQAGVDGHGSMFLAPDIELRAPVDGRGLAAGLLAPLFGILGVTHDDLLDMPADRYLERLRSDPRGRLTARQLLLQLSGFPAGEFQPLNPANLRAQLASGPDFERAALGWQQVWPAGSHFEPSPANAQWLALLAEQVSGLPFEQALDQLLWSRFAADDAIATLDHRRGNMAAHCCLRAAGADWLRLGLLLAGSGRVGTVQLVPPGAIDAMAVASPVNPGYGQGYRIIEDADAGQVLILETAGRQLLASRKTRRAVLWIGEGPAPAQLARLLRTANKDSP